MENETKNISQGKKHSTLKQGLIRGLEQKQNQDHFCVKVGDFSIYQIYITPTLSPPDIC